MITQLIVGLAVSGAVVYLRRARARRGAAYRRLLADLAYGLRTPLAGEAQGAGLAWQAGEWPACLQIRRFGEVEVPVLALGPDPRLEQPFTLVLRRGVDGVVEGPIQPLTGDRDFDGFVYAEGDLLAARAACNRKARQALLRVFQPATDEDFLELHGGCLAVSVALHDPGDQEAAWRRIRRIATLARCLAADPAPLLDRLVARLAEEQRADQRRLLLREILALAPDAPRTAQALLDALEDPAPVVRLDAMERVVGPAAWAAAARLAADEAQSAAHRQAALALLDGAPEATRVPTWRRILARPPGPLHAALCGRLAAAGDQASRPRLRQLVSLANDAVTQAACAALVALGDPPEAADEGVMLGILGDASPAVHRAVCEALVALGGIRALQALRQPAAHRAHAERQGQAALALGARLGLGGLAVTTGAPKGQLSLVEAEGALSAADDDR